MSETRPSILTARSDAIGTLQEESTLYCSSEWHLSQFKSNLAPLIYSHAFHVAGTSGIYFISLGTLAKYFKADYKTVWNAVRELVESGWFIVVSERKGDVTTYRVRDHKAWVREHPGLCTTKFEYPWTGEDGDRLAVEIYTASGGRVKCYANQIIALRKSRLSDTEIVLRWKQFLADNPPKSKQWKGALYRFMESLRS